MGDDESLDWHTLYSDCIFFPEKLSVSAANGEREKTHIMLYFLYLMEACLGTLAWLMRSDLATILMTNHSLAMLSIRDQAARRILPSSQWQGSNCPSIFTANIDLQGHVFQKNTSLMRSGD